MGTIQRPVKTGGNREYAAERAAGYITIRSAELDADFDTIVNAWNGGLLPFPAGSIPGTAIADLGITTAKLADGSVTDPKIVSMAYAKLTGAPTIPTTLPPSGAVPAGDLVGSSYPSPVIAPGVVTRAKTAADCWLPPIPTGSDVGKELMVAAGPTLAWSATAWVDSSGYLAPTKGGTYPVHTGYLSVAGKLDVLDIVTMSATPAVSAVTLHAVQGLGSVINGATLWKFDVAQSTAPQPTFLETVTASEAWGTNQGSNWNISVTKTGTSVPQLRVMVQGDGYTYLPNTLGLRVGGGVTPREMVDVVGAIIVAAHTQATPVAGTIEFDGTNFRGWNGTTWVIL